MAAFIIRRLMQAVMVMLTVGFIAFAMFNFTGDPVFNLVGPDATAEDRDPPRPSLALNKPFYVQYLRFIGNAAQGQFGTSYRVGMKVSTLLAERLPATLELVFAAALISIFIGVPLGVYTGIHRYGWLSR